MVQLILGDCLEEMKKIPDKSIDLVLTDPPYGVGFEYDVYKDSDENWVKMFSNLIPELKRISKMAILPCCQIRKLPYIYSNYPPDWLICWYKGSPGHCAFVGFNDWEPLLVYGKNDGIQMHDYFYCQPERLNDKDKQTHPCPKPVKWAKWLIDRTTKPKQTVLDPFMGSGTTGIACKDLDRNFIGIEISPKYFEIAQRRINQTMENLL